VSGLAGGAGLPRSALPSRERLRGWVGRTGRGAAQVPAALRLLASDRRLRRAALVPTVLTAIGCAIVAALATWLRDEEAGAGWLPRLHAFMVAFVALASMPPTILFRSWTRVAIEARRAFGLGPAEDPYAGRRWLSVMAAEWLKALRQALVVAVGLAPLLLLLWPLPDACWQALGGAWAFHWIVLDALELPIEVIPGPPPAAPRPWFTRALGRLGGSSALLRPARWAGRLAGRLSRPWVEEIHFTERSPWECAGFGLAAGVLLAVPGLGLLFRAAAIVAATGLVAELGVGAVGVAGTPTADDPGRDRSEELQLRP
jgi:hypothetical protein